ncbi:YdcH family protein [Marinobacter sp.]|uniref:YdcH family protein n=1 Tax=Marinobacter sp. TaxID=50741 RepID=UPI00356368BF
MSLEKHDLIHELPESREAIHQLKTGSTHFAKLFDEYHELDHEIHRIESGAENTSDDYLEDQKKQRLHLKDQLYSMIREYEASLAS